MMHKSAYCVRCMVTSSRGDLGINFHCILVFTGIYCQRVFEFPCVGINLHSANKEREEEMLLHCLRKSFFFSKIH